MITDRDYTLLLDTVKQTFASVVWTHKVQENQADIYVKRYRCFETIDIIAGALTSAGIVASIFEDAIWVKVAAGLLSFVSLAIAAYFKSFDLQTLAKAHKEAANGFLGIRDDLLVIISDIHRRKDIDGIDAAYKAVRTRLNKLYSTAPQTTKAALDAASEALGEDKEYTYSKEEIDRFLPESLRGDL